MRQGGSYWSDDKNVVKKYFQFPELNALATSTNWTASVPHLQR